MLVLSEEHHLWRVGAASRIISQGNRRNERMKKLAVWLLVLSMVIATLSTATAESPAQRASLAVGTATALTGNFFDPMFASSSSDRDVQFMLHGYNLVRYSIAHLTFGYDRGVINNLSAEETKDGTLKYTIELNPALTYSDGTPITVRDYAFSMMLHNAPEIVALGGKLPVSAPIVGAEEYREGRSDSLTGVSIIDDYTLVVAFKASYIPHYEQLGLLSYYPLPLHVLAPDCEVVDAGSGAMMVDKGYDPAQVVKKSTKFTKELLAETLVNGYMTSPEVVSGPYTLTKFDKEAQLVTFAKNPEFIGSTVAAIPEWETVSFRAADYQDLFDAYHNGDLDIISRIGTTNAHTTAKEIVRNGEAFSETYARRGSSFLVFANEDPITSDVNVRKAIAYAFNKDGFISDYIGVNYTRVDGYYGRGQWMYQLAIGTLLTSEVLADNPEWASVNLSKVEKYNPNLEEAARLLHASEYYLNEKGEKFGTSEGDIRTKRAENGALQVMKLKMVYPRGESLRLALEAHLVKPLKEIGVELTLEEKTFEDVQAIYHSPGNRDAQLMWMADNFSLVFDPVEYFGEGNSFGLRDTSLRNLAMAMRKTIPGDALNYARKWMAFQQRYAQVLPAIPVYSGDYMDLYRPGMKDYQILRSPSWALAMLTAYYE